MGTVAKRQDEALMSMMSPSYPGNDDHWFTASGLLVETGMGGARLAERGWEGLTVQTACGLPFLRTSTTLMEGPQLMDNSSGEIIFQYKWWCHPYSALAINLISDYIFLSSRSKDGNKF